MIDGRAFGRYGATARLVLVALRDGPHGIVALFDAVRVLDGPLGPATLFGAIARLERRRLIETMASPDGRRMYRLAQMETAR